MIPRLLHHIWLGPRPVPAEWPARWAALHPGWEAKVWREDDLEALPMRNAKLYRRLIAEGAWVSASDVARLEILWELGGVYTDIDSIPVRTLEGAPFLTGEVVAAYEPVPSLPGRIANGTIAAVPRAEAIDEARRLVGRMRVVDPPWATIGAPALTAALIVHERCCDVRVLASRAFFRTDHKGRPVAGREDTYIEHFWSSTNRTYPAEVVVLIPRRAGDPVRDANWSWCRAIWEQQGWRIVEGHHDEPGLFNASVARNRAAAAARDWDVAIFADADTVPFDWRPVREAVGIAAKTGKFVRPFSRYHMLDEDASASFMATGVLPRTGMRRLGESAYGGIHVVSRKLWEASGGYDERFLGWGSEDAAFEFACRALGGFHRIPGDVYHLWHPQQPRDPSTPQFQANIALGARYRAAQHSKDRTLDLIAERTPEADTFGLVLMTHGRGELLERTVASISERVAPLFTSLLICDDSGDPKYAAWLGERFPGFTIDAHRHLGHGPAVAHARQAARRLPVRWIFWSEDDVEYRRDVDLRELARVMNEDPRLAQIVLRRQAWFPAEVEAGGMIERFDPALFCEHSANGSTWLEHRVFYSLNPHLARRSTLGDVPWPGVPNSEHHYSRKLFRDPHVVVGLWGPRDGEPWVEHVGGARTGTGY